MTDPNTAMALSLGALSHEQEALLVDTGLFDFCVTCGFPIMPETRDSTCEDCRTLLEAETTE